MFIRYLIFCVYFLSLANFVENVCSDIVGYTCCTGRNLTCSSVETSIFSYPDDDFIMPDENSIELLLSNQYSDNERPLRHRVKRRTNISPPKRPTAKKFVIGRKKWSTKNDKNNRHSKNKDKDDLGYRPVEFEPEIRDSNDDDADLQVSHFGLPDDREDDKGVDYVDYLGDEKEIRYVIVGENGGKKLKKIYKIYGEKCYCDQMCRRLNDCCSDYHELCPGVDCSISQWSSWTSCRIENDANSMTRNRRDLCGPGVSHRSRSILKQSQNGGLICPHIAEDRSCFITENCNPQSNVALLLPYHFGSARTSSSKLYYDLPIDSYRRRNDQTSCVIFSTLWFNDCSDNKVHSDLGLPRKHICVECQPTAYLPHRDLLCPGEGIPEATSITYWSLISAKNCFGQWVRLQKRQNCNCQNNFPSLARFIFV